MPFPSLASPPPLFPTYLIPSLPFRRRQSSTSSNSTSTSTTSTSPPNDDSYLTAHASRLRCIRCATDLCLTSQIISKGFTGRHGRAYLVSAQPPHHSNTNPQLDPLNRNSIRRINDALPNLPNTYVHKPVPRQLVTGNHTVGDVSCAQCGSVLGWKYVAAEEEGQRYKIGKFILETRRVVKASAWEEDGLEGDEEGKAWNGAPLGQGREELVEWDSQDEDECEDLFLGVWTPQLAARRRKARVLARMGKEEV
ncbi:hypothetical protein MBLNU230_g0854t1 [Neophaeotheca triangularis]